MIRCPQIRHYGVRKGAALLLVLWLCFVMPFATLAETTLLQNTLRPTPTADSTELTLSDAQHRYLDLHPTITVAYGDPWEPILQFGDNGLPSGVSVLLLARLATLTGVRLRYMPLSAEGKYDILCYMPSDQILVKSAPVQASLPYITLPMSVVSQEGVTDVSRVAVVEGFTIPEDYPGGRITYYPNARECMEAVFTGAQTAAYLNHYAADSLLQIKRYSQLVAHSLEGLSVSICFGVPAEGDPLLLSILNQLIQRTDSTQMNGFIISSVLTSQSISLSTIADRMPPDVAVMITVVFVLLITLITLFVSREIRSRRERARASEVAAFLDYANKANDDVWEVDAVTRKRWRYHVGNGMVERISIPDISDHLIKRLVHVQDLAFVKERVQFIINQDAIKSQRQERFDCRVLQMDGNYRWTRIVFQHMQPDRVHPHNLMVYLMDVDNSIKAEENKNRLLKAALAQAQAAGEAQSDFTAYISHEIRSPLNAVLGYLTLAKGSIDQPDRLLDCFSKSEYAANHLLQLINDVLDMGSISSGHMRIAKIGFDIRHLIDTLSTLYAAQAKNRGLTYQVDAQALPHPYLIGDDLRIKQVIVNLLSNAMKFTPRGGTVTLTVCQWQDTPEHVRMRFIVQDTGVGMTEEFRQQLFSAYTQQDASIAGRFGGSGLGLSIAKQLVDLMEGTIAVQSKLGVGTTFTVELPFLPDTALHSAQSDTPTVGIRFIGKRLLLAEDNDMNMEIATELLQQEGGFTVDGVANGRAAVERFVTSAPGTYDAILMDVRMPEMDGYEATRTIRLSEHSDATTIPIIAMTANAFAEDVQLATEAGMDGHIAKPIDIHHVLATLYKVMQSKGKA